jgi:hypothetical protein
LYPGGNLFETGQLLLARLVQPVFSVTRLFLVKSFLVLPATSFGSKKLVDFIITTFRWTIIFLFYEKYVTSRRTLIPLGVSLLCLITTALVEHQYLILKYHRIASFHALDCSQFILSNDRI